MTDNCTTCDKCPTQLVSQHALLTAHSVGREVPKGDWWKGTLAMYANRLKGHSKKARLGRMQQSIMADDCSCRRVTWACFDQPDVQHERACTAALMLSQSRSAMHEALTQDEHRGHDGMGICKFEGCNEQRRSACAWEASALWDAGRLFLLYWHLQQGAHLLDAAEFQLEDLVGDGVLSGRGDVGDIATSAGGHHDPVVQQRVLVHIRIDVTARQPVPHLHHILELGCNLRALNLSPKS